MMWDLTAFAAVALVTVATPGPTTLLALNNGAQGGMRSALPGIAGALLSDLVLTTAAALGATALLAGSAIGFALLKWAGVAYLAWLGWRLLRANARGAMAVGGARRRPPAGRVFQRSFLVAVSNPKGYLFVSALLPQFVDPAQAPAPQFLNLALIFCSVDAAVMLGYAAAGAQSRQRLREPAARWLDRVCGGALLALAASLALYERQL